jgi:hypothetical protein
MGRTGKSGFVFFERKMFLMNCGHPSGGGKRFRLWRIRAAR